MSALRALAACLVAAVVATGCTTTSPEPADRSPATTPSPEVATPTETVMS